MFLCGTEENGESYLVEWNENEGSIVRNYQSLSKRSSTVVQFNTCLDRFLAAGDEHLIKIWDMDSDEVLAVIDADGGLQVSFLHFDVLNHFKAAARFNRAVLLGEPVYLLQ